MKSEEKVQDRETPIGAVDPKVTPTETDSREEETVLDVSSDTEEMESK